MENNSLPIPSYEPFIYRARVVSVYDGDTITCEIDLGLNIILHNQKIRLYGINAPELKKEERPAGLKSRDALRERILGKEVLLYTVKDKKGKYGRLLARVIYEGECMNDWLVSTNHAIYKTY